MSFSMSDLKRRRKDGERGAALVEFAIAIPIFIGLLLLIFDAGLGYSASRSSSSAARSAARVGALAGELRDADFRALDAIRSHYGDPSSIGVVIIYRSDASNTNGVPPTGCFAGSSEALACNTYTPAQLATLSAADFGTVIDPVTQRETCDSSAIDAAWCPTERREDDGSFLGVYISSAYDTTTGIESDAFTLEDRAVFSLYFSPAPISL